MKNKKIVYVPMGADIIHSGHLIVLKHAKIVERWLLVYLPTLPSLNIKGYL